MNFVDRQKYAEMDAFQAGLKKYQKFQKRAWKPDLDFPCW